MSVTLFFGIRLSGRPFERIRYKLDKNDFESYTAENLKIILVSEFLTNLPDHFNLVLIYCGLVLEDSMELSKGGIKSGSTIHVFESNNKREPVANPLTTNSISIAWVAYRNLRVSFPDYYKMNEIPPEIISQILKKYPELHNDLGALAILKDPILLLRMASYQYAKTMGEQYPILIDSAKFVTELILSHKESISPMPEAVTASLNPRNRRIIRRDQLAAALQSVGAAVQSTTQSPTSNLASSNSDGDSGSTQMIAHSQVYADQLIILREMGLRNESINLQALIICNGNIEEAVNLVLGIGNSA